MARVRVRNGVVEVAYGAVLFLFYGSIIVSAYMYGDFNVTEGPISARLPDINLVLQTCVGIFILLSPLHRRILGILSTLFSLAALSIVAFGEQTGSLGVLFVSLLLLVPSAYVLLSSWQPPGTAYEIRRRSIIGIAGVVAVLVILGLAGISKVLGK